MGAVIGAVGDPENDELRGSLMRIDGSVELDHPCLDVCAPPINASKTTEVVLRPCISAIWEDLDGVRPAFRWWGAEPPEKFVELSHSLFIPHGTRIVVKDA